MEYTYYKQKYPEDILVYVEDVDLPNEGVLLDFIDEKEYQNFQSITGYDFQDSQPSMIILTNYRGKKIQENTIYPIKPSTIQAWLDSDSISQQRISSYLIRYEVGLQGSSSSVFGNAISISDSKETDPFQFNRYSGGQTLNLDHLLKSGPNVAINIKNVGQGSWNEVKSDLNVKLVFDMGAAMQSSRHYVDSLIASIENDYQLSRPTLIISHWDKDHYHSLLAMSDNLLNRCFKSVICRKSPPNLTSINLLDRLRKAIGRDNSFEIPAGFRSDRKKPVRFERYSSCENQAVLYNAQTHKNRNISGIALVVKTRERSIIIPGDAHYAQLARDILPEFNYPHKHSLVVPHHGGKAGVFNYSKPNAVKFEKAVISVGENNYGHPRSIYVDALSKSGFNVSQTRFRGDIIVDL